MKSIRIDPADNGSIVKVGCLTLVFENIERLIVELRRYYENPEKVEKEYLAKYQKKLEPEQHYPLTMTQGQKRMGAPTP